MSKEKRAEVETVALPEPPKTENFVDANSFKAAIRDWAALYEVAYAKLYPASDADRLPPDPNRDPKPVMPPGPPEPAKQDGETREEYGKRLAEWLPKQEMWFFREYLPWEITRTKWYVSLSIKRDWEALRRLEARQKQEFRHRVVVAILRFGITGLVAGGVILIGLKVF